MLNPLEIDPYHLPALQAAILRHKSKLEEHLVSKLYRRARVGLVTEDQNEVNDAKVIIYKSRTGDTITSVTATDTDTGLFVVLSRSPDGKRQQLMFGQKYCQEAQDGMRQNGTIRIW